MYSYIKILHYKYSRNTSVDNMRSRIADHTGEYIIRTADTKQNYAYTIRELLKDHNVDINTDIVRFSINGRFESIDKVFTIESIDSGEDEALLRVHTWKTADRLRWR